MKSFSKKFLSLLKTDGQIMAQAHTDGNFVPIEKCIAMLNSVALNNSNAKVKFFIEFSDLNDCD